MEQQTSTARVALKWGAIAGVVSMIFAVVLYTTGQFANQSLTWLGILISVVFIVLAMREFRSLNGGYMSYGEGISVGTLLSAVSGLLSGTFNYIYTNFIDTTISQQVMDKLQEQWADQGLTDEQIEQATEMTASFQSPGLAFLFAIIGAVVGGLIISLIVAAFLRRNKPFAEFQ